MRRRRRREGEKRNTEPKRGAAGAAENESVTLRGVILFEGGGIFVRDCGHAPRRLLGGGGAAPAAPAAPTVEIAKKKTVSTQRGKAENRNTALNGARSAPRGEQREPNSATRIVGVWGDAPWRVVPPPPSRDHQFQTAEVAAVWRLRAHRLFGHTAVGDCASPVERSRGVAVGESQARRGWWQAGAGAAAAVGLGLHPATLPRPRARMLRIGRSQPRAKTVARKTSRTSLKRGPRLSLQRRLRGPGITILVMTAEHDN
eukprot:gene4714-biopygen8479